MVARQCRHCGGLTETPWRTVCDRDPCRQVEIERENAEIDDMATAFRRDLAAALARVRAENESANAGGER